MASCGLVSRSLTVRKWGYTQGNSRVESKFCGEVMKGEEHWAVTFHRPIRN